MADVVNGPPTQFQDAGPTILKIAGIDDLVRAISDSNFYVKAAGMPVDEWAERSGLK